MMSTILVVNAGSTSIKFKLFSSELTELISGMIENKKGKYIFELKKSGAEYDWEITEEDFNHNTAKLILKEIQEFSFDKIGFRVVHGGEKFSDPTLLNQESIAEIEKVSSLAPLHNPPALNVIAAFKEELPETKMFAVFDTAFHSTLPEKAYLYALPYKIYEEHKIRRYGFHGTSHKYVSEIFTKLEANSKKIISCHLGGGASITAIRDGKSIDTSMGFTPIEGLIMATRTGDIDAGAVLYLGEKLSMSYSELNDLLNKDSGLKGLSANTADMRKLLELEQLGDKLATAAITAYIYRIQKYIGAYAASLNGCDGLIFTAGVGQGSDVLRKRICEEMGYLNIRLDDQVNDGSINVKENLKISSLDSIPVWVIPTNEELEIAEQIIGL